MAFRLSDSNETGPKIFDAMIPNIHNKLQGAFDRLSKYCLSFSLEAENQDIKTIQDYENTILKWGQEIQLRQYLLSLSNAPCNLL
jgi:hypothetical protein